MARADVQDGDAFVQRGACHCEIGLIEASVGSALERPLDALSIHRRMNVLVPAADYDAVGVDHVAQAGTLNSSHAGTGAVQPATVVGLDLRLRDDDDARRATVVADGCKLPAEATAGPLNPLARRRFTNAEQLAEFGGGQAGLEAH